MAKRAVDSEGVASARRGPVTTATAGPRGATYLGVFCVAMAVLVLEIALTRIFAVQLWHHFAYLVVSLALLGIGAAGSLLTLRRLAEPPAGAGLRLGAFAAAFGLSACGAFFVVTRIRIDSLELWQEPSQALGLLAIFAVLLVPFLFAGLAIGAALSWNSRAIGRVYFADLVGAGIGSLGAPWLLDRLQPAVVVMLAGSLACVGGLAFVLPRRRPAGMTAAAAAVGLVLAVALAGGAGPVPGLSWPIPFAPHKGFPGMFFTSGSSERTLPSAIGQVDISEPMEAPMMAGADFGAGGRQRVELRAVTQDGTAPTSIYRGAAEVERFEALAHTQAATALLARRARGAGPPRVLVIGVGGGIDVMMALHHGAAEVTAVEINPAMIRMVTEEYAEFLGHLFDDPRVRLVKEDGRAFLRRGEERYDLIQLTGVDTYTALSTGAYTLAESYLYTVEAVREMYERLEDGGLINYSRFVLAPPRRPRETVRLANIARAALSAAGVAEPGRQIAVFQGYGWASTMIRKGPFGAAELEALRRFQQEEGFFGLIYDPSSRAGEPYNLGRAFFLRAMPPRMLPRAEGVRPSREAWRQLQVALVRALEGEGAASDAAVERAAAEVTAPGLAEAEVLGAMLQNRDTIAAYVARYTDALIDLQATLGTLLQGGPDERAALVEGYPYDISPTSDDRPFFFDYFRPGSLLDAPRDVKWYEAQPEFPVGHMVLVTSLVLVTALAAVLILVPLVPLARRGHALAGKWRLLAYFAALGLGFMLIEICLMQKLILFLGHPSRALSVVLAGMLVFAGLGSLASERLPAASRRSLGAVAVVVVGLSLAYAFGLRALLSPLMALELPFRIVVALAAIAPLGFVLGLPFPLGIRVVERRAPVLVPWAWGVNGFFSVLGSILAIVLAMGLGFTGVLVTAALVYAAGLACLPVPGRAGAASQGPPPGRSA